ncbi:hypothetical protein MPSEU_000887500 [Mayamaea pseudoterrestris]|nr:hypothetical protein MPSEU_000887500 [Mayamaea pseudoterrestris]
MFSFHSALFLLLAPTLLAFTPIAVSRTKQRIIIPPTTLTMSDSSRYTNPNQPERFATAKKENNERYLDITTVYDPLFLKGKRVAITGANRGIGLALAKEVTEAGAKLIALCRSSSDELEALKPEELVTGIDVQDDEACSKLASKISGGPIDILVNNAGYFMEEVEKLDSLNFPEQIKTIDICACGPLRVASGLLNGNLLKEGSKIIMITSQGGSISWRPVQNPKGTDYGHHMSKAAANMMAVLLSLEVKDKGIAVGIFHPGFNKTGMTAKYKEIWDKEGAVDASIGAKRIMHETGQLSMETTGKFLNCEDGLEIPW